VRLRGHNTTPPALEKGENRMVGYVTLDGTHGPIMTEGRGMNNCFVAGARK
jgi:hypothetical protein